MAWKGRKYQRRRQLPHYKSHAERNVGMVVPSSVRTRSVPGEVLDSWSVFGSAYLPRTHHHIHTPQGPEQQLQTHSHSLSPHAHPCTPLQIHCYLHFLDCFPSPRGRPHHSPLAEFPPHVLLSYGSTSWLPLSLHSLYLSLSHHFLLYPHFSPSLSSLPCGLEGTEADPFCSSWSSSPRPLLSCPCCRHQPH